MSCLRRCLINSPAIHLLSSRRAPMVARFVSSKNDSGSFVSNDEAEAINKIAQLDPHSNQKHNSTLLSRLKLINQQESQAREKGGYFEHSATPESTSFESQTQLYDRVENQNTNRRSLMSQELTNYIQRNHGFVQDSLQFQSYASGSQPKYRFGGNKSKRLGIFGEKNKTKPNEIQNQFSSESLWDDIEREELLNAASPPQNAFDEQIELTLQGKLWKLPIDNQTDLADEEPVPFYEHVFLERHLAKGFPKRGPVRHFMELICTGLSKNPYLSVKEKVAHIDWFRDYFKEHATLLRESIVILQIKQKVRKTASSA